MRVAFLHGFAGTPAVWDGIAAPDDLRVALPGHDPPASPFGSADPERSLGLGGGPVRPSWDENLATMGDALTGVDLVVGYSLGARVALGLVATGRVPRAILISVNAGIDDAERAARRASDATWSALLRERGIEQFVDAWEAQPLFATQARVPAERRAARRVARLALDPHALAASLDAMGLAAMPDYRGAVTADRIALVAGSDDAKFLALARALPAPLAVIAGSGHDPTLEQPAALATALTGLR